MSKLRKATKDDQPAIFALVVSVLADYGLETDPATTDRDLSDLNAHYFDNNGWFAVIENEGKIIGSYGIYRIDERICELRKMYLLPEYQGQGLGKQMMEDALKKARELGYKEMILESNRRLDKALRLYSKYGFREYHPDHLSERCNFAMKRKI